MLNKEKQEEVIALCQALIRRPSNSGHEDGVVAELTAFFKEKGFDDIFVDAYGSVTGAINGKRPGPTIVFDGHIDTVPVPDPSVWKHDPYKAERVNGRIYGRGSSDMKGSVAAMACAVASFAEATKRDFGGRLCVAGVVHEECFEGIAASLISERVKPDYVVIGEASECNLKIGQRGRAEITVETFGVPAHSANPEKGVNAVLLMTEVVKRFAEIKPTEHPVLGKGVSVLTDIISTPYPGASVVPSGCRATYDRRLLTGETRESVMAPYAAAMAELERAMPNFKGKVNFARGSEKCHTGNVIEGERFFPGWLFDENEAFVQKSLAGLREIGLDPAVTHYSFCTNGSHYAGEKGIKTLGFGPSPENLAHTIDEYIEEEQLFKACEGYQAICKALTE